MSYLPRIADKILKTKLRSSGAVLIQGPKWCGKTTTGQNICKSEIHLDDPDRSTAYIKTAEIEPTSLLNGETPRLLDEWQLAPSLWNAVRYEVDRRGVMGQFVLTGSSLPKPLSNESHSGTGRISLFKMRTMSLYESNESTGCVSLGDLFNGKPATGQGKQYSLLDLAYLICRGGWPQALNLDKEDALEVAFNYVDAIINLDTERYRNITKVKLDPFRVERVLKSYARNNAQSVANETIRKDAIGGENLTFSINTLNKYTKFLRSIFLFEESHAWNPNLRSKTAIRTSDTQYFIDPSIGTASLGIGPKDLLNDINTMGLYFENMAIRDLRTYAEALKGTIYHYRDKSGLECDAVIHLRNGDYGLVEIKLGGQNLIDEGAKNLLSLSDMIDTEYMKKPSFLMVLTGKEDIAYKRSDGVNVVPVSCLKP